MLAGFVCWFIVGLIAVFGRCEFLFCDYGMWFVCGLLSWVGWFGLLGV